jgi:flagellar protein FlaF
LALRLRDSKERADAAGILEAVRVNWRLWTILQADLLGQECPLPDDLRGSLLSLARFIDKHTVDIIADPKPEKLDVLISINRELAGGLFTTPSRGGDGEGSGDGAGDRPVAVSA